MEILIKDGRTYRVVPVISFTINEDFTEVEIVTIEDAKTHTYVISSVFRDQIVSILDRLTKNHVIFTHIEIEKKGKSEFPVVVEKTANERGNEYKPVDRMVLSYLND